MALVGMNFPQVFGPDGSTIVVGKDTSKYGNQYTGDVAKIRADLNLILRQEINKFIMKPYLGIDWEAILFADDISITRDFIKTFVSEAIVNSVPNTELAEVAVAHEQDELKISLAFSYNRGSEGFVLDYTIGGLLYE